MRDGQSETGKYIAVVRDSGSSFAANQLRFETAEEANNYVRSLSLRWLAITAYAVIPYDTPKDISGSYWSLEAVKQAVIGDLVIL